jgi:hypothetical protein
VEGQPAVGMLCFLSKNIQQKKKDARACDVRTVAVSVVVVLSVALEAKRFETKNSAWQLPPPLQISRVQASLNVVTFYSFGQSCDSSSPNTDIASGGVSEHNQLAAAGRQTCYRVAVTRSAVCLQAK